MSYIIRYRLVMVLLALCARETVCEVDNPLWFGQSSWFRLGLKLMFNDVSFKEQSQDDTKTRLNVI